MNSVRWAEIDQLGGGGAAFGTARRSASWPHEQALVQVARALLADPRAPVDPWHAEPVPHDFGSPTTAGLFRLRGRALQAGPDGAAVFLKLIRSFRHWPVVAHLPPEQQQLALSSPLWRYEIELYARGLGDALPPGLRLPRVLAISELGDDVVALFLEDVEVDPTPWSESTFAHAAEVLGRMAARLTNADALPPMASRLPSEVTRLHYTSRLLLSALPALQSDAIWSHPLLAAFTAQELRRDLMALAGRIRAMLTELVRLPQVLMHGDASPQNLLVPVDEPGSFVAIDWTIGGLAAVGDDLGQLLVGLAHAGLLEVHELPGLHDVIVHSYTTGLAAEKLEVAEPDVRYGMDAGLVVRSAFTALPLDRLGEPVTDELAGLVESRLALTRYLVDVGLALPIGSSLRSFTGRNRPSRRTVRT